MEIWHLKDLKRSFGEILFLFSVPPPAHIYQKNSCNPNNKKMRALQHIGSLDVLGDALVISKFVASEMHFCLYGHFMSLSTAYFKVSGKFSNSLINNYGYQMIAYYRTEHFALFWLSHYFSSGS